LSRKRLDRDQEDGEEAPEDGTPSPARPRERELRGGTGSGSGQLISMPPATEQKPVTEE
jgi:hypothetical protein